MPEAGCQNMAKTQKTFLLNPQLLELVDKVAERSGANFTKIVTAALLQYFFDYCAHPEDAGPIVCPANEWMGRASRLDRGAITVADIPNEVLKEAVDSAKYMLDMHTRGELKEGLADGWKRALRAREVALQGWEKAVEENKGAMPAILEEIEDFYRMARNG